MNFMTRWFGRRSPTNLAPPQPPAATAPLLREPAAHPADTDTHFTLVRHSRYAVSADPAFEGAVEVRELTRNQAYVARSAGGVIFSSQPDAAEAEAATNVADQTMPSGTARGYFSSVRIGGAEVYIPAALPLASNQSNRERNYGQGAQ